jgi:hypothetical protein
MLGGMDSTPPREQSAPPPSRGHEMPARHRPREHYVREALHKLDEHRFAVPVVTPRFAPALEQSTDW